MPNQSASWPGGRTYVFQGTVLEDATGGTHVSSLTVTPGAGNEMEIRYGLFTAGAGAANLLSVFIDDAANRLTNLVPPGVSLASGQTWSFPSTNQVVSNGVTPGGFVPVSGAQRFIMSVSTATVSLTHAFAVVCRVFGDSPTFTLADTVGSPTLTTNTSGFF